METYSFRGVEGASGRVRVGRIEAASRAAAVERLAAQGLRLTGLRPTRALGEWRDGRWGGVRRRLRPASLEERVRLTRQLGMLLAAGLPLLAALELLARQERRESRRYALEALVATVREGIPLSRGLARGPGGFDPLSVSLVRAGEAAGTLDSTLLRLARVLEASARLRARVLTALAYPALVALIAGAVVAALLLFVVPRFEQLFLAQFPGRTLPGLTRAVLALSRVAVDQGPWLIPAGPVVAIGTAWIARRAARWTSWRRWLEHVPVVGRVGTGVWVARWSRTLGLLLGAGVPILEALALARDAAGAVDGRRSALAAAEARVAAGSPLSRALADGGPVPETLLALLEVGEATGRLPETLERAADLYDEQVDRAVAALTAMVEPCLIVLLAVGVGTVVIALFLPMIDLIRALSGG